MSPHWHLLFPLLSSLLYVGGALFIKRCAELGVGVWRTAFVSNLASALLFMPLWALGGGGQPWNQFWQPAVVALLLVIGQVLGFVALSRGDVSVATPVLGVKTVLVALFTTALLTQGVPPKLWMGAGLSALAIGFLHGGGGGVHRKAGLSAITAVLAAICFALFDVLVQRFSPRWGVGRFLPIMNAMAAALSFGMVPLFHAPLRAVPRAAWPAVLGAAGFIAVQGLILITTVAWFGDATAVNIVYSSRGLWSVAAVWLIGHWFSSQEQHLGRRVLGWRLAGAALMTIAIVLALV